MRRRRLLLALGAVGGIAGCAGDGGDDGDDIADSDGDGVIDSEDYAPRDPDVQERDDVRGTAAGSPPTPTQRTTTGATSPTAATTVDGPSRGPATTGRTQSTPPWEATATTYPEPTTLPDLTVRTTSSDPGTTVTTRTGTATTATEPSTTTTALATATETSTTTVPTTTATTTERSHETLAVTDDYYEGISRIEEYSADVVRGVVTPSYPVTDYDDARLYIACSAYPGGARVGEAYSDSFRRSGGSESFEFAFDSADWPVGDRLFYQAFLLPADETVGSAESAAIQTVMETDPFERRSDGSVVRSPHPAALGPESGSYYARDVVEGRYLLELSGATAGTEWTVSYWASKSSYVEARTRPRTRAREEYPAYELSEGTAALWASALAEQAEGLGFTSKAEQVNFVIDVIQRLPYVPDEVSTDYDDYTKYIMETVPELGGDCEDTAVMAASILQAEPFTYDMILVQPPGHMAAGIWGEESIDGVYYELDGRRYYFLETTGNGWSIGDCPEEYRGESAYLFQVP